MQDFEDILEMFEDYTPDPRPMVPEPRNMYNQGQLVSNTDDGSRPGYSGFAEDVSDVYNESTGHIYKKGNRFKTVYSKTPTLNQHKVNLRDPKYTDEVIKFIDENPTFNQKQGIKELGRKRAELIPADQWGKPGKKWDDEKVKIRAKKKKQWTDKYSKSDIQSKLSGSDGLDYHHAGGKRELVSTGNTMYLDSEINRKKIQKFERALNKIQKQQYQTELNRNMPIEEKRKIFDDLKKQEATLRAANPEFSKYKSSLIFEESALSPKTGYMKKEVMSNPELTISEGKTGQKLTLKGKKIDSSEGKKIIELSKKAFGNSWCNTKQIVKKAGGGRIGFSGSCSVEVKQKNFLKMTNDVATGKITGEAAEQIAKNAGKVVAKVGSKSALASIFGPAGIGLDIAFEVGSIGTDVLGGKSFNRALQDNWITGAFISGTGQEEFHKELYAKDSKAKPYGQAQDLIVAYNNAQKNIDLIKQSNYRARGLKEQALAGAEKDLRGIEASYNALTKHGKIMEEGSPEYENYMSVKTEFEDAAKAKSYASKQKLKFALDPPESNRFKPSYKPTGMKIDFNFPQNYTTFKPTLPTIEDLNKIWKDEGYKGTVPTDRAKEFITGEKWRQEFEQPGIRGTQDWRGATGGLAGLMKKYYD